MEYKRIDIRLPVVGKVNLVSNLGVVIEASAFDISENGIGIHEITTCPENAEYKIQIKTISYGKTHFSGILVHTYKNTAGFKITNIDSTNLRILKQIINDFQAAEEFIKRIDTHDITRDYARKEINLIFEMHRYPNQPQ